MEFKNAQIQEGVIMAGKSSNLGRRQFMVVSSAAIATPLLLGAAESMKAAETKSTKDKLAKGTKVYFIGHGCVGCHTCMSLCPVKAIHFGNTGNEIDQGICVHCGTCFDNCPLSMISEAEI